MTGCPEAQGTWTVHQANDYLGDMEHARVCRAGGWQCAEEGGRSRGSTGGTLWVLSTAGLQWTQWTHKHAESQRGYLGHIQRTRVGRAGGRQADKQGGHSRGSVVVARRSQAGWAACERQDLHTCAPFHHVSWNRSSICITRRNPCHAPYGRTGRHCMHAWLE